MIIQLIGVGTVNKGAYLMLLSILEHFEKKHPEKQIVFVTNFGSSFSEKDGQELGVRRLVITKRINIEFNPIFQLLPFALRKKTNLFLENDVDVILDASGFRYGDQWSTTKIRLRLSDKIRDFKLQKKKVIILPQAFGPFERKEIAKEVGKIIENADLVFARDSISYNYLKDTFGEREKIKQAPDFTNLLEVKNRSDQNRRVLVIPNFKLVDKTETTRENLVQDFRWIIEQVRKNGRKPELLVHEGVRDEQIAMDINESLEMKVPIMIEKDARKQKEIIGSAYAVISARFHGLVSALSQGVPSMAFSWSHKYEMLLTDYGQDKYLFIKGNPENKLLIRELLDSETNSEIRKELEVKRKIQEKRSLEMWKEVEKVVFSLKDVIILKAKLTFLTRTLETGP